MLVNNVKSVNTKYIFFINDDGKEDRKTTHYAELQEILDDLQNDYYFYNRMLREVETSYNKINSDRDRMEKTIVEKENYIKEHYEEPAIRRGLADVYFTYERLKRDHDKITMELCGIGIVRSDARNKLERIERLINEIQSAMRVISK